MIYCFPYGRRNHGAPGFGSIPNYTQWSDVREAPIIDSSGLWPERLRRVEKGVAVNNVFSTSCGRRKKGFYHGVVRPVEWRRPIGRLRAVDDRFVFVSTARGDRFICVRLDPRFFVTIRQPSKLTSLAHSVVTSADCKTSLSRHE